jgi:FkbM family methyltransferase
VIIKSETDRDLGEVYFPQGDTVMAPFIEEHGTWEPAEVQWLIVKIALGSNCLNVSANVEYFAKWMSRLSGPTRSVVAVEPNPNLIPLLRMNLQTERFSNYQVLELAAGGPESSGIAVLFVNERNNGGNRLIDPTKVIDEHDHTWYGFDSEPKTVSVRINTLDNELGESRVNVVLIDTQGWDFEVVEGLAKTLKQWRPNVLLEFTPSWLEARGLSPLNSLEAALGFGYTLTCPDLNVRL